MQKIALKHPFFCDKKGCFSLPNLYFCSVSFFTQERENIQKEERH